MSPIDPRDHRLGETSLWAGEVLAEATVTEFGSETAKADNSPIQPADRRGALGSQVPVCRPTGPESFVHHIIVTDPLTTLGRGRVCNQTSAAGTHDAADPPISFTTPRVMADPPPSGIRQSALARHHLEPRSARPDCAPSRCQSQICRAPSASRTDQGPSQHRALNARKLSLVAPRSMQKPPHSGGFLPSDLPRQVAVAPSRFELPLPP